MKIKHVLSVAAVVVLGTGCLPITSAEAAGPTPPVSVTTQPADLTVNQGANAAFTAAATDADLQDVPATTWQSQPVGGGSWTDVSGTAGQGTLGLASVASALDGTSYRALFDDGLGGTIASDVATLTVHFAPHITTQPQDQTVAPGDAFSLTAEADGDPAPTIRWQSGESVSGPWMDIDGATATTYYGVASSDPNSTAWYRAVFSNSVSTVSSSVVTVSTGDVAPAGVDYVDVSNPSSGMLKVNWPASSGGGSVSSYTVHVNHGGDALRTTSTTGRTATFSGLTVGTYTASVIANNSTGSSQETFSESIVVEVQKRVASISRGVLRPYHDGFQDVVTLRVTTAFASSGRAVVLNSVGKSVRSFAIPKGTSWSATFNGRSSSGKVLAFGHYKVRFTLGSKVVSTRALSISRTNSALTSGSFSPSTVFPFHDGYQDHTRLSLTTNMPATMTITITKSGSSQVVASHNVSLHVNGSYLWSASNGGKPLPAGRYRAKIVVKGGDGSPRISYRYVTVSAKRLVAKTWSGYITATNAYDGALTGDPTNVGSGRMAFFSFSDPDLADDIGLFSLRLPSSFEHRYSQLKFSGCVDPDSPFGGNEAAAILVTAAGDPTSKGFAIPDSGCSKSIAVPHSYIFDKDKFSWAAGNASDNDDIGVVDEFDITVKIYKLQ